MRTTILMLAVALTFSAGCGGEESTPDDTDQASSALFGPPPVILSVCAQGNCCFSGVCCKGCEPCDMEVEVNGIMETWHFSCDPVQPNLITAVPQAPFGAGGSCPRAAPSCGPRVACSALGPC